jgi:uncharacterized protein
MKNRRRTGRNVILYILLVLLIGSVIYNVYDNHRFIVVEQQIALDRLPQSFDGFRILQISDLHDRYFGEKQADLINTINGLEYDMIALTGDMNASTAVDDSVVNSQAILDLLEGIESKEYIFWVDGNTGPYASVSNDGVKTGALTEIGESLHEKGCKILIRPYAITRANDRIWIAPDQLFDRESHLSFHNIEGNGELKIMLTHIPKQINLTAAELRKYDAHTDYDLILAGHYHGGQWRLPLLGALYIPSPTTGISNSGYFPSQDAVKGWSHCGDIPQYVSAGLGATDHAPLTSFRLFNTPEINLITLRTNRLP